MIARLWRLWCAYQRWMSELVLPSCDDCGRWDCRCARDPFGNVLTPHTEWRPR